MSYTTLEIEQRPVATGGQNASSRVAWVWMNKPAVHNAFDETLIAELTAALQALDADPAVRVIVLAGRGKSFSAGADLNWMQRQAAASQAENIADAERLAGLFRTLSTLAKPTIARVHGAALGGGMGLASACDICVASERAQFATSEVRFGIIPSAISPYVIRAIGERQAYRYFQTAERISAARAREIGLVHEVTSADGDALDAQVQTLVDALLAGGPQAQAAATALIRAVANKPMDDAVVADTARRIATLRATDEAREGLAAFLQKRPAAWVPSTPDEKAGS
jgi:methylglutaconyl-CoA hydratase